MNKSFLSMLGAYYVFTSLVNQSKPRHNIDFTPMQKGMSNKELHGAGKKKRRKR